MTATRTPPDRGLSGVRVCMWRKPGDSEYTMGKDSGRFGDQAVDDQALDWFNAGYCVAVLRIEYVRVQGRGATGSAPTYEGAGDKRRVNG